MEANHSIYRRVNRRRRGAVRNIAEDLKERIEAVRTEMVAAKIEFDTARRDLEEVYRGKHSFANSRLEALQLLLEQETGLPAPPLRAAVVDKLRLPLPDFLISSLSSSGPQNKDEIRSMVEMHGYVGENESAGRTVHTTLMNLVKSKKIRQLADGQYEAVNIFQ